MSAGRQISTRGRDAILEHEEVRLRAYDDATGKTWSHGQPHVGYITIGVGHLLTRRELETGYLVIGGIRVRWTEAITHDEALELLDQDLDVAEDAVERLAPGLSDNQFAALVSFVFNVGVGAFEHPDPKRPGRPSGVLRAIREGRFDDVPGELAKWNRSKGRVVSGLVNRRRKEGELWAA